MFHHDATFVTSMSAAFEQAHFHNNLAEQDPTSVSSPSDQNDSIIENQKVLSDSHRVAGLSCEQYGGPNDEFAQEMVYWEDIPSDAKYKSPFYDENKYLTFEPDHGGWNNIRMAMETVLVMAHATGRTLVLPPEARMYLLGGAFTFNDFFHLDSIDAEHEGLNIITMEEFLKREGGKLPNLSTKKLEKVPDDRMNWDGEDLMPLWKYLRKVGYIDISWNPTECLAGFPATKGSNAIKELQEIDTRIRAMAKDDNNPDNFTGKPVGSDAPAFERLRENLGGRKGLCIYDQEMQDAKLVHFKVDHSDKARMLTHFYGFVFFADWKQDLWTKRFVRDHVRYLDKIFCAAGRIVHAIREEAKAKDPENQTGDFDAFHIRRGDFQYKKTRLEAKDLFDISAPHLNEGTTLYIATDEKNKTFFNMFKDRYSVFYLDDFLHLVKDIPPNYYGMLDQVVASRSQTFFGTWFSTFSGYINRMRGYYSVANNLEGNEDGKIRSWYFFPTDRREEMQLYRSVRLPLYMREFPTSWRDIDKAIGELK